MGHGIMESDNMKSIGQLIDECLQFWDNLSIQDKRILSYFINADIYDIPEDDEIQLYNLYDRLVNTKSEVNNG